MNRIKVLVIDNYDSFTYNLVQLVGSLGKKVQVFRNDEISLKRAHKLEPDRIIISPGPGNPSNPKDFGVSLDILKEMSPEIPTLGVCLGHQGIVYAFGGKISRAKKIMHGKTSMIDHDGRGIYENVENPFQATRYHSLVGDEKSIPSVLNITATSMDDREIMGVRHNKYPIEGVQFHPESILTSQGHRIMKNFLEERLY